MELPVTHGDPRFNPIRKIVREAMNDVKSLEWDQDPEVSKIALHTWYLLEVVFADLGLFTEE